MPTKLPQIEPVIPDGYVFIAITMQDPDAPVAIMGFPTRRIVTDGGPVVDWPASPENIEAEIKKAQFKVTSWRIIRYEEIPKDRTYRDALKDIGGTLGHHIPTVRKIALRHLREDRAPLLADLDIQWMRAFGQGNTTKAAAIEAQRQALRDKPATVATAVEAAQTIEEIHAIVTE